MNKRYLHFLQHWQFFEKPYLDDDRYPLVNLYKRFENLNQGWIKQVIFWQQIQRDQIPVVSFRTRRKGKALWLLAGIHGEEPAGPNALAASVDILNALEQEKIPMVVIPVCNPIGYLKNWRYPNEYRNIHLGFSVGDADHLLLDDFQRPRRQKPISRDAELFTRAVLKFCKSRPPILLMDFHEDEDHRGDDALSYIYSQGKLGIHDPVAQMVVGILYNHDVPLKESGLTPLNEPIVNGIVNAINDGSIDELCASDKVYVDGSICTKPACASVIVIETPTVGVELEKRVNTHKEIIENLENFYFTSLTME